MKRVRQDVAVMARTDVQLMLDVKAGDEQSFELLLRRYRTPLVNFLYRMVLDTGVAEGLNPEDRATLKELAHLHVGMAADSPGM